MPNIYSLRPARVLALLLCLAAGVSATAQGIHFSQFVNMPMLISPANTGLMTEHDYRANIQYRNQWGAVPVPFNTFAVAGDLQALRRSRVDNWLGFGAVILNDRAGEGSLTMTRIQLNGAYHLSLGKRQMLSVGLGVASVARRINISQLVFDAQWDGYSFNPNAPNMEPVQGRRAGYLDISTGANYIFFPNKYLYIKATVGVDHVNYPVESVFRGGNIVKPRTHALIESVMLLNGRSVFTPTLYFTTQQKAWEAMIGGNVSVPLFDSKDSESLIAGIYYRVNDAIVVMAGYEYKQLRFTASYDYTVSNLGQYISHNGAFEIGISYRGRYRRPAQAKNMETPISGEGPRGKMWVK